MRIHCIKHEPFKGLASIENWIRNNGHELSVTYTYMNQVLPIDCEFDMLIIMGGAASIYNSLNEPWLIDEKKFVEKCIQRNKTILGICLGSQIIAEVLGVNVYAAQEKEIGWFPVNFNMHELAHLHFLPESLNTFHWHGDTYDLPADATRIASSDCTENQGFIFNKNVVALQFHPEITLSSLQNLLKANGSELEQTGLYIQNATDILRKQNLIEANTQFMFHLMNHLEQRTLIHSN